MQRLCQMAHAGKPDIRNIWTICQRSNGPVLNHNLTQTSPRFYHNLTQIQGPTQEQLEQWAKEANDKNLWIKIQKNLIQEQHEVVLQAERDEEEAKKQAIIDEQNAEILRQSQGKRDREEGRYVFYDLTLWCLCVSMI